MTCVLYSIDFGTGRVNISPLWNYCFPRLGIQWTSPDNLYDMMMIQHNVFFMTFCKTMVILKRITYVWLNFVCLLKQSFLSSCNPTLILDQVEETMTTGELAGIPSQVSTKKHTYSQYAFPHLKCLELIRVSCRSETPSLCFFVEMAELRR